MLGLYVAGLLWNLYSNRGINHGPPFRFGIVGALLGPLDEWSVFWGIPLTERIIASQWCLCVQWQSVCCLAVLMIWKRRILPMYVRLSWLSPWSRWGGITDLLPLRFAGSDAFIGRNLKAATVFNSGCSVLGFVNYVATVTLILIPLLLMDSTRLLAQYFHSWQQKSYLPCNEQDPPDDYVCYWLKIDLESAQNGDGLSATGKAIQLWFMPVMVRAGF